MCNALTVLAIVAVLLTAILAESNSNNRAFGEPAKPIQSTEQ
jgi:hypothetical protein